MIIKSFLLYLPGLLAGFGLLHLLWKDPSISALGLKAFLGIGVGVGITSCLYFLRLLLFPGQGGYLLIELVFLFVILLLLIVQKRSASGSLPFSFTMDRYALLLGFLVLIVAALTLYNLVVSARLGPHGDYDAQAIWNLRARFIHRLGNDWRDSFSPEINRNFHMDYPLLIPTSVVGGWNTLGDEVLRVPGTLSMLFWFGMAGILYFFVSHVRTSSQASIATLLLLATPGLLLRASFQTADIPLSYFFLASACSLVLAGIENNKGLFFLSGLMAGLAAWTKNEGLPFVLILIFTSLVLFGSGQTRKHIPQLMMGLVLPAVTILSFKTLITAENDLLTNNPLAAIFQKVLTPERYVQIGEFLISELWNLGGWPVSILIVLGLYAIILGVQRLNHRAEKILWILPLLQFAAYILIYLITPHDLQWHLMYSMDRLLLHLFPLVLCFYFLCVKPPELAINKVQ